MCLTLRDSTEYSRPGFPVLHYLLKFAQIHVHCALCWRCYLTISSSAAPFSFCLQSFSASGAFPISQLFTSGGQTIRTSASASVLPMNIPCSPRDSQESSPTPQFKSINSLALCLLYCPTVTPIHDHWKNHSFDVLIVSLLSMLP